jgi:DNA repair protein RecN (Recombination protein N)
MALDEALAPSIESLTQARSLIEDAVYRLRQGMDKIESDPQKLEAMQARLSELRKLQKKFGPSVDEILSQADRMQEEIQKLENSESELQKLEEQLSDLNLDLEKMAKKLSQKRKSGSSMLADSVNHELADLNMKGVLFCVQIEPKNELGATGTDQVEFLSQTAPKDPPRPLARFASGGELSRILLSLKRVVGSSHFPRTYLFDEVDTGVSGPTAEKVGKKLRSISKGQQVICITHLPQVAACGDAHFYIKKSESKGLVEMDVTELENKSRIQEIARLISGETISKTSLAHAKQLLEQNA